MLTGFLIAYFKTFVSFLHTSCPRRWNSWRT